MGTVAINRPPTVSFRECHLEDDGQQESPGRQRQSSWAPSATEAKAATVNAQALMVELG